MKKNTMLRLMALLTLVTSSSFIMQARSERSQASECQESGKGSMKKIEREISQILKSFRKDNDADKANSKLDAVAPKIKRAVAKMKKSEEHGSMWEVHQHTLERKLREARAYVTKHAKA